MGADSSRWLLFAARPAFTDLAVRFSCSQPSFTPFIIPLSVLLTLFTHFYHFPSQNQASPSTPGGLSSRALSCGTTCSPRPQSSLTSPPCLHSDRNRSPQPRLELQKAAQKHLRWINGDGGESALGSRALPGRALRGGTRSRTGSIRCVLSLLWFPCQ